MANLTHRVRIKPELEVDSYNDFQKSKGFYQVDAATAKWCETRRLNDHNPNAPHVFDVGLADEMSVIVAAETKVVTEKIGTVEAPLTLNGPVAPGFVAEEPSQPEPKAKAEEPGQPPDAKSKSK